MIKRKSLFEVKKNHENIRETDIKTIFRALENKRSFIKEFNLKIEDEVIVVSPNEIGHVHRYFTCKIKLDKKNSSIKLNYSMNQVVKLLVIISLMISIIGIAIIFLFNFFLNYNNKIVNIIPVLLFIQGTIIIVNFRIKAGETNHNIEKIFNESKGANGCFSSL